MKMGLSIHGSFDVYLGHFPGVCEAFSADLNLQKGIDRLNAENEEVNGPFDVDMELFCGNVGLCCGYIGLLCGYIRLFCGYPGALWRVWCFFDVRVGLF